MAQQILVKVDGWLTMDSDRYIRFWSGTKKPYKTVTEKTTENPDRPAREVLFSWFLPDSNIDFLVLPKDEYPVPEGLTPDNPVQFTLALFREIRPC